MKVKLRDALILADRKFKRPAGVHIYDRSAAEQAPLGDLITWMMDLSEIDFKRSVNCGSPHGGISCDHQVNRQVTESPYPKGNLEGGGPALG